MPLALTIPLTATIKSSAYASSDQEQVPPGEAPSCLTSMHLLTTAAAPPLSCVCGRAAASRGSLSPLPPSLSCLQLAAPPAQTAVKDPFEPSPDPFSVVVAGTQTASGGTSAGVSLAAIVSPFAALRMDPLQEGDEAQASPMRPGPAVGPGPQGSSAAPAGSMPAPISSGEALWQLMEQLLICICCQLWPQHRQERCQLLSHVDPC